MESMMLKQKKSGRNFLFDYRDGKLQNEFLNKNGFEFTESDIRGMDGIYNFKNS